MPRAKISEFSTTAGDNTDIDGINIAEGCAPSGINDAIRELMAQLKDFQSGAAGDNITVVGTLAAKGTSSSGADLKLYEDTDNGTNYVGFIAPASIASNVQWTLPSADGSSGQALQTNGSGTLSFATLGISAGGTGQTTANAAFNALAPSQTSNAGRYLKTDGTNTSWDLLDISTADITGTLPVANGGTGITSFGTGVATALGINVGSSGAFVTNGGALGTPSSGTVTNLTGTASININGTVGATTPNTGSFTTLTTSSTVTINGGTANGVAYLNGSKVLTTGSALTFDGTTLKVGTTGATNYRLLVSRGGTAGELAQFTDGTAQSLTFESDASSILINSANGGALRFGVSTEQMRLTSTSLYTASGINVGIGTSSPGARLHSYVASGAGALILENGANTGVYARWKRPNREYYLALDINNNGGNDFSLYDATAAATRWTVDSSGNLGLGVTPSGWGSSFRAIDAASGANGGGAFSGFFSTSIARNAYNDGTNWRAKYTADERPALYAQPYGGGHQWFNGNAFVTAGGIVSMTQAMTLDASGQLVVGATTAEARLQATAANPTSGVVAFFQNTSTSSQTGAKIKFDVGNVGVSGLGTPEGSTNALAFYVGGMTSASERARITSGGILYVNSTDNGYTSDLKLSVTGATGGGTFLFKNDAGASQWTGWVWNTATSGDNLFINFMTEAGGTGRGSIIYNRGGGLLAFNTTSDYRAKDILGPVTDSGATIDALKVYMGKMKGATIERPMLIAHEAQEVTPYAVTGEKDAVNADGTPKYQQMDHQILVPLLIAEVQSLRARVAQLEAK
jgi:hypothetical protein